jgi:non-ribosomal peptide synthetase component F
MYKTGDLVRWLQLLPEGAAAAGAEDSTCCLEFLGRVDHQVKLRGFRIELQVRVDGPEESRGWDLAQSS